MRLADGCMGHGVEKGCWAQSPNGWGKEIASSSGINTLEGMARREAWGPRQGKMSPGVGS